MKLALSVTDIIVHHICFPRISLFNFRTGLSSEKFDKIEIFTSSLLDPVVVGTTINRLVQSCGYQGNSLLSTK
jgi:hypothetical protein